MLAQSKTSTAKGFVEFRLTVPRGLSKQIRTILNGINALAEESGILISEDGVCLERMQRPKVGIVLAGFRKREGMTQAELSGKIGISQDKISLVENGKRKITKEEAHLLAELFNTTPQTFL